MARRRVGVDVIRVQHCSEGGRISAQGVYETGLYAGARPSFTSSLDLTGDEWGIDLMLLNAGDKDGMNSSMTDVFGVAGTGIEYIPPRQIMGRVSYNF